MTWRLYAFLLWFAPVYLLCGTTLQLLKVCDNLFFPQWKQARIEAPLFIVASPRSGTTFLHRLMSLDEQRFTSQTLWKTLFPSVTAYRLVAALGRLDRSIGRPLGRLLDLVERKTFEGWQGIHATSFTEPEEDEGLFVFFAVTPSIFMLFPAPADVPEATDLRRLPLQARATAKGLYRDALMRHMFAEGDGRTLLVKSVFAATRLDVMLDNFPDARVVHLTRHPFEAIPSAVSMFSRPWSALYPQLVPTSAATAELGQVFTHIYREYMTLEARLGPERYLHLRYEDLIRDPESTVLTVYRHFDMPIDRDFRKRLYEATHRQRDYKSGHEYTLQGFGIRPDDVVLTLHDAFYTYGYDPNVAEDQARAKGGL